MSPDISIFLVICRMLSVSRTLGRDLADKIDRDINLAFGHGITYSRLLSMLRGTYVIGLVCLFSSMYPKS